MSGKRIAAVFLALALIVGLFAACSINPATGKRQLTLIGEGEEVQLGLENDKAIVASMGLYDDDDLQRYVQQLGRRLASRSERPNLEWTFRVIDDPIVNAFALPGGYIYVTRGILAHFNSETELAAVLGHEIGHVTARHGVNQMSKATLAQLGLGVGMIVSEGVQKYGGLLQTGMSLLFLKYSRDDERQADDLGLRYLVRGEFDPRPMPGVYTMLQRVGEASGGSGPPAWMSTHPAPENREQRMQASIAAMNQDFSGRAVNRESYIQRLDGIVFGDNPRDGYFKDGRFNHPEMKFRVDFPSGWKTSNQRASVSASSPGEDALVQLTLASQSSPGEALNAFFSEQPLQRDRTWRDRINGLPCASQYFSVAATPEQQGIRGLVAFVQYDGKVFGMLGVAAETAWSSYEAGVAGALGSFAPLTDGAALAVEPMRIEVVQSTRARSLADFGSGNGSKVPLATLALINGLPENGRVEAGKSYKIVTGGRLP